MDPKKMKSVPRTRGKREGPGCPSSRTGNWNVSTQIKTPRAVKIPPPI
jgi:hypothetical protein